MGSRVVVRVMLSETTTNVSNQTASYVISAMNQVLIGVIAQRICHTGMITLPQFHAQFLMTTCVGHELMEK
jgi:hypothetical protein